MLVSEVLSIEQLVTSVGESVFVSCLRYGCSYVKINISPSISHIKIFYIFDNIFSFLCSGVKEIGIVHAT